jgi:hypothetical protein
LEYITVLLGRYGQNPLLKSASTAIGDEKTKSNGLSLHGIFEQRLGLSAR